MRNHHDICLWRDWGVSWNNSWGKPVSEARFEPGVFPIRSRIVTHTSAPFGHPVKREDKRIYMKSSGTRTEGYNMNLKLRWQITYWFTANISLFRSPIDMVSFAFALLSSIETEQHKFAVLNAVTKIQSQFATNLTAHTFQFKSSDLISSLGKTSPQSLPTNRTLQKVFWAL